MSVREELIIRSGSVCELCSTTSNLDIFELENSPTSGAEASIWICETCKEQIENPDTVEVNHWRCLNDSMWSPVPAVQVMA